MLSLHLLKSGISTSSILTFAFTSLFLISLGIAHNAFAMGSASSSCNNLYSGTVTSFLINNGSQTFDAVANPGVTFNVSTGNNYNTTFVIRAANESTLNNTNSGYTWYTTNAPSFWWGACVGSVGPNQNATVFEEWIDPYAKYQEFTQGASFQSYNGNTISYTVHWIPASSSTSTVPSAPQNLQTTASNSQVSLSWSTPSNNGGSPITNYNVYRGTESGNETLLTQIGNVISYNDTTVTNGQQYFYKVTAVNSIGESAQSNEASATPTSPTTAPGVPTGLAATATSSSQINLSWTAPANNGGSAIAGYMVERSTDNGATWSTIVSNTGSTTTVYNDTDLAANTAYAYRVSAINSVGTSSSSNTASATTDKVGIALNNVQSTSGTVSSSNQITILNFNVGSDNNRLLVVGVSANNNNVASVTFGRTPLKNIASSFYNNDAEFWYLQNPSGTGDITVTMNGPTQAVVGAYAFSGVNQTVPIPTHVAKHNANPNNPNISITTKYANDWVLDLPSIYGGSTLGKSTCTQQWDVNVPNEITGASSSTVVSSPAAVTCKWTASSTDLWDDAAVEINAAR